MSRAADLARFLEGTAWRGAARHPLSGDASARSYQRLSGGPSPALLVDAPPPEDTATFLRMADWLRRHGLLAPRVHAADPAAGFLVVEDLGDALLSRLCEQAGSLEQDLYLRACDELLRLQEAAVPDFLPPYDDAFFLAEIGIFLEWAARDLPGASAEDFRQRWREVLPQVRETTDVVVHRDFHALNLLAVGERVALIDFQGARIGPPAYDLASLLVDARRDVAPATRGAVLKHYLGKRPGVEANALGRAFAIMTAQRCTKILGLFQRLARRDGKPLYLDLLPRVRTQLEQALCHPALRPIRDWHREHGLGS